MKILVIGHVDHGKTTSGTIPSDLFKTTIQN